MLSADTFGFENIYTQDYPDEILNNIFVPIDNEIDDLIEPGITPIFPLYQLSNNSCTQNFFETKVTEYFLTTLTVIILILVICLLTVL